MLHLDCKNLENGAIVVFTHDIWLAKETNVVGAWLLNVITQDDVIHNITILITDKQLYTDKKKGELFEVIKQSYGENFKEMHEVWY